MAESGESAPKASELYLGIVDLFAVILPGAIIAFLVQRSFDLNSDSEWLKGAQGWAVFLAASYIVGHLVSALGGVLLDKIYDTGFKLNPTHRSYFSIRLRARDVMKSVLKSSFEDKDNAMEWAGIIVRLRSAPASAEIDRLEADSKFFRSFTTVLILGWPIWISLIFYLNPQRPPFTNQRPLCTRAFAWALSLLSLLLIGWLRRYVGRREKLHNLPKPAATAPCGPSRINLESRVSENIKNDEPLAVPCWKATWRSTLGWALLVIGSGALLNRTLAFIGAVCAILAVFSGWRYMELRLKRTRLTYAYAIALSLQPPSKDEGTKPDTP